MAKKTTVELEPITDAVIRAADERNKVRKASVLFVTHAVLDEWHEMLLLRLRGGLELRIPIQAVREIADEPIEHLRHVKATATGGILFEDLGIALDSIGLLRELLGALSTPAKAAAARTNGRKGGRPHKRAA
jgi:hypothetical protein